MAAQPGVFNSQGAYGPVTDGGSYAREILSGQVAFNPALAPSATSAAVASSGTITTAGVAVARVTPASAVTSVVLQAGTVDGQFVLVENDAVAARSVTFAAAGTSNVLGGTAVAIPGQTGMVFQWNAGTARWIPVLPASSFSAAVAPGAGIAVATGTGPTVFHSGGLAPATTTTGTDTTPVVTETYICEVYVPVNATITGIAILNGSAVAGNIVVALYDNTGAVVANSALAGTAASGTAAYQQVPFTAPYAAVGPAKYFIGLQNNNTSNRYRSHILGNFGASKKTGETFGTLTTITPPTTFTTNLGPIADTY